MATMIVVFIIELGVLAAISYLALSGLFAEVWWLWLLFAIDLLLVLYQLFFKQNPLITRKSNKNQAAEKQTFCKKHSGTSVTQQQTHPTNGSGNYCAQQQTLSKKCRGNSTFSAAENEPFQPLLPLPHVDETFDMTGAEFEQYVAEVYRRLGKRAVVTTASHDQGIDVVVGRFFRTGIQAKCYNKAVGNKAVQEAAAGRSFHGLRRVAVVTNSFFSDSAKSLAKKTGVQLIDRKVLAAMVRKANNNTSKG